MGVRNLNHLTGRDLLQWAMDVIRGSRVVEAPRVSGNGLSMLKSRL